MRNVLIILLASSFLFSCEKTDQQKAEISAIEYLKINIDDPSSYEAVLFDSLRMATLEDIPRYLIYYKDMKDLENDKLIGYSDTTLLNRMIDDCKEGMHDIEKQKDTKYKYKISHTYRAKNKHGALEKKSNIFILDENFNVSDTTSYSTLLMLRIKYQIANKDN